MQTLSPSAASARRDWRGAAFSLPLPRFDDGTPVRIENLLVKARSLAPAAPTEHRLRRLLERESEDPVLLGRAFERDAAMVAALLRKAGTLYGDPPFALRADELVQMLGTAYLREVVGAASALRTLGGPAAPYADELRGRMVQSAVASRLVARYTAELDAEVAFLTGLLLDIGQLVLATALPARYAELMEHARLLGRPLAELETRWIGFSHAELGFVLAQEWRFPRLYTSAIGLQHNLSGALFLLEPKEALSVATCGLAATMAEAVRREEPPALSALLSHPAQAVLRLETDVLANLYAECERAFFDLGAAQRDV